MAGRYRLPALLALSVLSSLCLTSEAQAQYGIVLSGVGPVNRSMGGASVGAPLDASGAIHWNPATLSALNRSEMEFGLEALYTRPRLYSTINQGALGPIFGPPLTLSGSTESEYGAVPVPTLGICYQPCDSPWTFGLGMFAVGGIGTNYPASDTNPINWNPITTPQAPNGFGLGAIYSNLQVMQLVPTVAVKVNDQLSIGFAPTLSMANLQADPLFITAPDNANGDFFGTYPGGTHTRITWGAGFQAGVYYQLNEEWGFGASYKSPQWFEEFRFQSTNELGFNRLVKFDFEYPGIISVGAGYTGIPNVLLALDIRWVDYDAAEGFNKVGFDPNAAVLGIGWKSIFAIAFGAQWQATDSCSLRIGYTWNENAVPSEYAFFNASAPAIIQNTLYFGASYKVNDFFTISGGYAHGFENTISGPMIHPVFGPLPGTQVKSSLYADTLMFGATVRF